MFTSKASPLSTGEIIRCLGAAPVRNCNNLKRKYLGQHCSQPATLQPLIGKCIATDCYCDTAPYFLIPVQLCPHRAERDNPDNIDSPLRYDFTATFKDKYCNNLCCNCIHRIPGPTWETRGGLLLLLSRPAANRWLVSANFTGRPWRFLPSPSLRRPDPPWSLPCQ